MSEEITLEEIKELAESVTSFFLVFDGLFLHDEKAEELLKETKAGLEEKVLHNESCLPLIIAMGGNYDSEVDRAKIEEIEAVLNLVKARKNLQKATEREQTKKNNNAQLLALFGITKNTEGEK